MRNRELAGLVALVLCLGGLAACGEDRDPQEAPASPVPADAIRHDPAHARTAIKVGSKDFTEQQVLGEIFAQSFAAAGFRVSTALDQESETLALRRLRSGAIDGYPEYTSTALVSFCDVEARSIPLDPALAFRAARACLRRMGLRAFAPAPFTTSFEVGVPGDTARRLRLRTISDLVPHDQDFVFYGTPECRLRSDCLQGLRSVYGLRFRRFAGVNPVERHDVLNRRDDAVSIVYETDAQIRRENVVLLQDDRGMFPSYNSTFVMRGDVARAAGPGLGRVIAKVQRGLTDEVMQELNARVEIDRESPREAARSYLRASGLVP
jgi:glycine betaine/choline ABC-type transport system substrate-binding protein